MISQQPPGKGVKLTRRTILIFYYSAIANILSPLARRLRSEHGYRVVLIATYRRSLPSPKFYDFDLADFDEVHFCGDLLKPMVGDDLPSRKELAERAWVLEERYGISVLDFVRGDRMIGIDFVVTSDFHRSKIGRICSHDQAIDMAIRLSLYMENILRLRPMVIIGYPGSVFTNALISIGEAQGIPMRYLYPPRRENYFRWVCDRWGWPQRLREIYSEEISAVSGEDEMAAAVSSGVFEPVASDRFVAVRDQIQKEASFLSLLVRMKRHLRKNLPDVIRRRQPLYDSYLISEKLRTEWRSWLGGRRSLREKPMFQTLPSGAPFVFFPLTAEPEITLMVECAAASTQLTYVDWLSKGLPAGWRLLVKEHPTQPSDRIAGFWDQIRRYPNVVVLAVHENAEEVVGKAKGVATINGTTGLHAAARGLPVLTFHEHNIATLMPHVTYCASFEETRAALRDIAAGRGPDDQTCRAAALAFDKALRRGEFPITDTDMLAGKAAGSVMDEHEFDALLNALVETLPDHQKLDGSGEKIAEN
ncbi:MAG: hypothetical protein HQ495_12985 [Alphaproteobacteria bacterium]|nr:hypothetical protein [Alphaproteobacteria bacterium]